MTPLRVLHVNQGLLIGGGEALTRDLRAGLPALGVETSLAVLGPPHPAFDGSGATFMGHTGGLRDPRAVARCVRRLRALVRRSGARIVHSHGWDADLMTALAIGWGPQRHVSHLHDRRDWLASSRLGPRLKRAVGRRLLGRSRATFIAVCGAVAEYARAHMGWPAARVHVVRNGVRVDQFVAAAPPARPPGAPLVVGCAARLTPPKGLDHLVRAAARLRERGVACTLRIAGEGGMRDALRALAEALDVALALPGQVADMPAFYRDLDVFVLPSLTEGLPLTVLEAMAVGRPVVATPVGGTAEALRDGTDGLLVPPGDADALADAIARLAGDPERRRRMGDQGQARVRAQFSTETMCRGVAAVYRALVS